MKDNFQKLIQKLENELPPFINNDHLIQLGLHNDVGLFRMRANGEVPFVKTSKARIIYLKTDIIEWLKKSYHKKSTQQEEEKICCGVSHV